MELDYQKHVPSRSTCLYELLNRYFSELKNPFMNKKHILSNGVMHFQI